MSIAEFVSHLRNLDIRLSAEDDRLRVNAPKGVLTQGLRAQIAERKRELLEFLRDHDQPTTFVPPPILRRVSGNPEPLSFAQERLWFLEQLEPGSNVYNICRAFRVIGDLNVAALESGLNEIVRRHEVLRSSIRVFAARPIQVVQPPFELNLSVIELHATSDVEREQKIRDRIQQAAEAPFDFAAGKFLRAELLCVADDNHVLIVATHHIVSDAWSMGILTRELWSLYETYAAGKSSQLEELQIQYADFAAWQRKWLQGKVLEGEASYWKEQLKDLPILNLPTDHPRPVKQSFRGARQPLSLPESLTAAVNELSRREGVTQFMTLLAAFQVLLCRYSGQGDIVVGSPIANRNRSETERLIGFFVNTLILRSDCSGEPSFREFLLRVRDVCLGAYAHQDLPFEKLVEELRPERNLSRNPLFQVMFVLQNTPRPVHKISGLEIERIDVESETSQFDLSLFLRERNAKLIGFIEYTTDLFDRSTIQRMAGHFETLLMRIATNPNQQISTLPMLTDSERHRILIEWNDTAADYLRNSCVHELFEAQVERTPEAIAVEFEKKSLTYRELNSRANQLAHYLEGLGIGPEKLVGICVKRSLEMVVGLLGILKAGGAYVALDPSYPSQRLAFMLKDSHCSVLLTKQKLVEDREWRIDDGDSQFLRPSSGQASILDPQMKVVCLDTDSEIIASESEQNPRSEVKPHNLAYVIYTSGSTGMPKGVAIEHRNTVNLLQWAKTVYGPTELAGVLASTSVCFDLSVFEMFLPLCCGGKVILVENALCLDGTLERSDVTLINTVPSVMVELLKAGALLKSIRTVNLAGEPLQAKLVKQIYDLGHIEKVYDLYGPSETTTYSTFTLRTPNGPNTIGRPISNTQVYILDSHLQPVSIGSYGEICIGGHGVARGYLNRLELTSERFVPHPFSDDPANRIYRTGDRGRYLPDGNIEFIGRMDNQVKIRGYRIELGEIEAVLTNHPNVKDCVVVAGQREAHSGRNIVGYVVLREHSLLSDTELRSYLKEKLPEYMIPSSFVVLEALPLTPNRKVDRNRLPPPDGTRPPLRGEFVPPRTEVEELIAQTWREVLKIEVVGIYDNFFELGGHSLLATQIVARLQEAFNKEVPLHVLFDHPTIAELAQALETIVRDGHTPELPPIVSVPRDGPLPLSMNQEHLWRLDQAIPGTHFFNMPYVYQLKGDLDINVFEKALGEIVKRHEALRTVFAEVDGSPVQLIRLVSDFELPVIDLRSEAPGDLEQRAAGVVLEEREEAFDLTAGPLFRIKLLRLTDKDYFLLVTMHHIISDHGSVEIFRRELAELYEAFSWGRASPLTEPTIQFTDYSSWERRLLNDGYLNEQLAFWKNQINRPLPRLEFQKSGIQKNELSFRTARLPLELDETLFTDIKALARRENCTPFMVLVAALSVLLYLQTGQQDIRIGTLAANRSGRDSQGLIGHFVNTVILRTVLSPDMTWKQLLMHVRQVTLAAYANQKLPFERLARVLEEERKIERSSLFQILLSYQNSTFQAQKLTGLTFASLGGQLPTLDSKVTLTAYDLILNLREASTKFTGSVNYKTDAFDNGVVVSMVERFATILKHMVADTGERYSLIPDTLRA